MVCYNRFMAKTPSVYDIINHNVAPDEVIERYKLIVQTDYQTLAIDVKTDEPITKNGVEILTGRGTVPSAVLYQDQVIRNWVDGLHSVKNKVDSYTDKFAKARFHKLQFENKNGRCDDEILYELKLLQNRVKSIDSIEFLRKRISLFLSNNREINENFDEIEKIEQLGSLIRKLSKKIDAFTPKNKRQLELFL
jgi:hypothetical protein